MRKTIQITLVLILMQFLGVIVGISQEITEKPKENTANNSQAIQLAAEIDECAKLLEKSAEAVKSLRTLTANLENEISERKKLQAITDEEITALRQTIDALKAVIAEQQKLIEILSKQSKTKIKVCIIC